MKHLMTFGSIALVLFSLAGPVVAQEWKAVVLKANSFKEDGSGNLIVKLASGATIKIPKEDWSSEWSAAVDEAIKNQEMEKAARSSAEPPSDAIAAAMIHSHCAKEWPDDFKMRKYCEDQQYEGLRALRARQMTGVLAKIRSKCATEWPEDFKMRDYCEKQQIEALRKLNR
ncbi:MAG: hypothetical protein GWN62_11540 [Aliifodinibius sp.]|nr:hypothetical protein [Fodinibius sp.]